MKQAGTIGEHGVILPPAQPLTSERLIRHGLFLLEDGQNMFLWVGRDAVPQLIQDVFDLPGYEALRAGKVGNLLSSFTIPVLLNTADHDARARQPILSARERRHPKDPREPSWSVLATSVCGEGGRRARTTPLGTLVPYSGSFRCAAELSAVLAASKRQGECFFGVCNLNVDDAHSFDR